MMRCTKKCIKRCIIPLSTCGALLAAGAFADYGNNALEITKYYSPKGLYNEKLKGMKIVHLSDLQYKTFGDANKDLIDNVKALEPNIIVFTGDLLDRRFREFTVGLELMSQLIEICPVFYCEGNHELSFSSQSLKEFYGSMRQLGVNVLRNGLAEFDYKGSKVSIIGISETMLTCAHKNRMKTREDIPLPKLIDKVENLVSQTRDSELSIILAHEPQFLWEYAREGVDLIFSGHAHGGQIRLPLIGGLFAPGQGILPKLTQGVIRLRNTRMIISRGLGNSIFPFRIFNRPEIILLKIQ